MKQKMNITNDNIPTKNIIKTGKKNLTDKSSMKFNFVPNHTEHSLIQGSTSDNNRNGSEETNQPKENQSQNIFSQGTNLKNLQILNMMLSGNVNNIKAIIPIQNETENNTQVQFNILLEKSLIKSIARSFVHQLFNRVDYNELFKEILNEYLIKQNDGIKAEIIPDESSIITNNCYLPKIEKTKDLKEIFLNLDTENNLNNLTNKKTKRENLMDHPCEVKKNKINLCGHPNMPHYAKNMCKNCYFKQGRLKKAHCSHTDQALYALGMCKHCYQALYSKKRNRRTKSVKPKSSSENDLTDLMPNLNSSNSEFYENQFKNNLVDDFINNDNDNNNNDKNLSLNLLGNFDFLNFNDINNPNINNNNFNTIRDNNSNGMTTANINKAKSNSNSSINTIDFL